MSEAFKLVHHWEDRSMCIYCGWYCARCNDCQCGNAKDYQEPWTAKDWEEFLVGNKYTACPGFDTHAGKLRPRKESSET